jgi:hypothetical protein
MPKTTETDVVDFAPAPELPKAIKEKPDLARRWLARYDAALEYARPSPWPVPAEDDLTYTHLVAAKADKPALLEMEVFRAGTYGADGWKGTYSERDVRAMASDYEPDYHEAPVTLDHVDRGPAYGWVQSLRATPDGRLFATLKQLSDELIEWLRAGVYRKRSVEIYRDFPATGRPYLRAVTFLGAGVPEVKGMPDADLSEMDARAAVFDNLEFQGGEDAGDMAGEPPDRGEGLEDAQIDDRPLNLDDDGQHYPAEAYLHAPDPADPATWRWRVWTDAAGTTTSRRLGQLCAGLSPGGLSGERFAVPADELPAVRARLRAEYRRLGVAWDSVPRWAKEDYQMEHGEERAALAEVVPIEASAADNPKAWPVKIITAGRARGIDLFYPAATLSRRETAALYEGARMEADHPKPAGVGDGGVPTVGRPWVAVLKDVKYDATRQALVGRAHVIEDWFQSKLENLSDAGSLESMRVSINAYGAVFKQKMDGGEEVRVVDRFTRVRSVDFVSQDAAGGHVMLVAAAGDEDVNTITLDRLHELRPDLMHSKSALTRSRSRWQRRTRNSRRSRANATNSRRRPKPHDARRPRRASPRRWTRRCRKPNPRCRSLRNGAFERRTRTRSRRTAWPRRSPPGRRTSRRRARRRPSRRATAAPARPTRSATSRCASDGSPGRWTT